MDCSCEIDVDIQDGAPSFCEQKIHKARKQHKCNECKRTIEPGEEYEKTCGLWGGDFETYKTCADCLSIRTVFFITYYFEMILDELREYVNDSNGDIPEDCITELTPAARDTVCEMIETFWTNNPE